MAPARSWQRNPKWARLELPLPAWFKVEVVLIIIHPSVSVFAIPSLSPSPLLSPGTGLFYSSLACNRPCRALLLCNKQKAVFLAHIAFDGHESHKPSYLRAPSRQGPPTHLLDPHAERLNLISALTLPPSQLSQSVSPSPAASQLGSLCALNLFSNAPRLRSSSSCFFCSSPVYDNPLATTNETLTPASINDYNFYIDIPFSLSLSLRSAILQLLQLLSTYTAA